MLDVLICLVTGYIFGCFQTGYFYGRLHGIDIRDYGSGNAGTTNTLRVLGKKAGYITYVGDALKAIIAILLMKYVLFGMFVKPEIGLELIQAYTGLGVAIGHNFPFYLGFKGGKGIASTSGVMLAMDLRIGLLGIIGFFLIFFSTRYVSVGSLWLSLAFPIGVLIFYPGHWHLFIVSVIFWLMAWYRHKENIKRLLNGTENRFDKKKKN